MATPFRVSLFQMNIQKVTLLCCLLGALIAAATLSARQTGTPRPISGSEYSGMYAFLRDGEFVQVTVEDQGQVTGFISRYGEQEGDRGAFLDHFFKTGKIDGNKLTFTTKTVHGVLFEFQGTIEIGENKKRGEEGYYVLKGTLTQTDTDENKKTTSKSREVALKSFPADAPPDNENKK